MSARKIDVSLGNLSRALDRLAEALEQPEDNPLVIDGTIQRFEFALELFWKTLQRLLADEGIEVATPREVGAASGHRVGDQGQTLLSVAGPPGDGLAELYL